MPKWVSYSESDPAYNSGESSASHSVFGPPMVSVAWIPYYADVEKIEGPNAVINPRWKDAFVQVLSSGNSAPPFHFTGPADVVGFLATKNYRAALGLCDVRLDKGPSGTPDRVSFSFLQDVGFTAVRIGGEPTVRKYFRGTAVVDEHPEIEWHRDEGFVEIVHRVKFRLSGLLALAAKLKR